jgi:putative effector of murein hydrolase LrgA (UPF0299 family)
MTETGLRSGDTDYSPRFTAATISSRATEGLRGLCILFAFLLAGEGVISLLHLPFPGAVIGMLLLTVALRIGIVRPEWIRLTARTLLFFLPLLFVPLCVILFHPPVATVSALLRYGVLGLLGTLILLLGTPLCLFLLFSFALGRREARRSGKPE